MPDQTLRTFKVFFESPLNAGTFTATTTLEKAVQASYFQEGGISGISSDDSKRFVVFKDADHKPVFTVRAASVITIEEIRD